MVDDVKSLIALNTEDKGVLEIVAAQQFKQLVQVNHLHPVLGDGEPLHVLLNPGVSLERDLLFEDEFQAIKRLHIGHYVNV